MHSIFILVFCLALLCSTPIKAEDDRPSILFLEPHDLAAYEIFSEPKNEIESMVEDETHSLPEPHPSVIPSKEELGPQLPLDTENGNSPNSLEEKQPEKPNTWAIWHEDTENTSAIKPINANSTIAQAATNPITSQEPASTPINQASTTLYETILPIDDNPNAKLTPSSPSVKVSPSSPQISDTIISSNSKAQINPKTEEDASPTLSSASKSATLVQSSALTSPLANGDNFSSSSPNLLTGSYATTTQTQQASDIVASTTPYPSLDSEPLNSTLPTTSYEPMPSQETSSINESKLKTISLDLTSVVLSTATYSNLAPSSLNATNTIVFTSNTPSLTSISLQPLPTNGSSTIQISTTNTIVTSGTAIYPSFTSSTLVPTTGNGSATITPSISSITIPLLTTTLPQQSSSLSGNTTYTSIPLSNLTSSYFLPTSTQVKTTALSTAPSIIKPTATNTASTFIPSSIIAQTSSTHISGQSTQTQATGIPSALPKIVQNPLSSFTPSQPVDTSEVQIGFEWALNYPFVVSHPLSTTQIFTYLPIGIADGLGLRPEQIVVKNLLPLDTTAELQFITTVARVFIPSSMVDTLRVDLGIAASPIYQNPDESVKTLMNYINPAIPFFPGAVMEPGATSTLSENKNTPNSKPGDAGVFNSSPQQPQSPSAKGTTAGIAIAACGGAAAYGAAMFLLARRYKHRQQRQKRPSSMESSYETGNEISGEVNSGNYGDAGLLMSGGRISPTTHDRHSRGSGRTGNTTRNAQISGPVMSENSLGWS